MNNHLTTGGRLVKKWIVSAMEMIADHLRFNPVLV
jgi:hypothetical protein